MNLSVSLEGKTITALIDSGAQCVWYFSQICKTIKIEDSSFEHITRYRGELVGLMYHIWDM